MTNSLRPKKHVIVIRQPGVPSNDGPVLLVSYISIDDFSLFVFVQKVRNKQSVSFKFLHGAVRKSLSCRLLGLSEFLGGFHSRNYAHSIRKGVVQLCIQFFREVFPEGV